VRYLIVSETYGFFLGAHASYVFESIFGKTDSGSKNKMYAIFAKENPFGIYAAASFSSKADAQYYMDNYLSKIHNDLKIVDVESNHKHVSVTDLIRAGFVEYTHDMMDNLPMFSEEIH
jgi:hypothetical protein